MIGNIHNEIKVRNISADICDLFEELLDRYDITIPSVDRSGDDGEARLFGEPYSVSEDAVTGIIVELCEEIKKTPSVTINSDEY